MRNGEIIDTLTSIDIAEKVKSGGFGAFFCHILEYNPYTELVTDMFEKRGSFKSQKKIYFST